MRSLTWASTCCSCPATGLGLAVPTRAYRVLLRGPPACPRSSFSRLLLTRASGTRPSSRPPLVLGLPHVPPHPRPGPPSLVWTRSSDPWSPSGPAPVAGRPAWGGCSPQQGGGGQVLGAQGEGPHTPPSLSLRRPRCAQALSSGEDPAAKTRGRPVSQLGRPPLAADDTRRDSAGFQARVRAGARPAGSCPCGWKSAVLRIPVRGTVLLAFLLSAATLSGAPPVGPFWSRDPQVQS